MTETKAINSAVGKIAVIGAGNIGEALIAGLIKAGIDPATIVATNRSPARSAELAQRYSIATTQDNVEAATNAGACFLCVKPYQILEVIEEISAATADKETTTTLISMAAGITLAAMEKAVASDGAPLVRVMPNTAMLVGKGVHVVAFGNYVDDQAREQISNLLRGTGRVVEIPEKLFDAATPLSGSGPAYFFLVTEAMVDAGVSLGLPRNVALELATATAAGAGEMLVGEDSPSDLRHAVCSPKGTTIAAIRELEESGIRGAFYRATEAAAQRSAELGE